MGAGTLLLGRSSLALSSPVLPSLYGLLQLTLTDRVKAASVGQSVLLVLILLAVIGRWHQRV